MTSLNESVASEPVSFINWSTNRGVAEDVNNIITQTLDIFDDNCELRIKHFHTVWKSMSFGLIFHGRQSYRELYEFTEDLLGHTRNLCLHPNDFGRRAAAFYLLYTLYFKQPCRPKVRIRVEYYQYEDLCHWMNELRSGCHWELVYCWAKLVTDNAFLFVGTTKPVGLENSGRNQDRFGLNPTGRSKKRNFETQQEPIFNKDSFSMMLERMTKTHNRYVNMKKALIGEEKFDSGLAQASDYFPSVMKEIFSNPKSHEKVTGNFLSENGRTIGQRRKEIIEKSFGTNANTLGEEHEESNDIPEVNDEDWKPGLKGKGKGKGKKRKSKPDMINIDLSQDLKSLCKSLAAVKEDPSLLSGINDDDVIMPKKKLKTGTGKRGRPRKNLSNDGDNNDPLEISPKIEIKKKKKKDKHKLKIKKLKIKPIPIPETLPQAQPSIFDI